MTSHIERSIPVEVTLEDSRTGKKVVFNARTAIITKRTRYKEEAVNANILAWKTPIKDELTITTDFSALADMTQAPRQIGQ